MKKKKKYIVDESKLTSEILNVGFIDEDVYSRYSLKPVNENYYRKMNLSGNTKTTPILTEEDFNAGKAGIVYMDTKTGKLKF